MIERYLVIGLGAAFLLAFTGAVVQSNRLHKAKEEIAVLESRVADKDAVIAKQAKGIGDMITASRAAEAALKAAGDTLDTTLQLLAAERAKRNAKVETDYAKPDCAALLATDLASVCPAHAQRLRDAARR